MTTSVGQAILAMFESDIVSSAGAPLVTLITALQANKGNLLAQEAAWLQFVAAAPTAGISLEIEVEGQLLSAILTKVQAEIAAKATKAVA
jgi:hypothetical protein